jgi:hypothetical protein
MIEHLAKYSFTKDYTKWTYHTETGRMRGEVVRRCIEELDGHVGVTYMIDDFHEAHFQGEPSKEEPEPSAKAYNDMLAIAQKPLHEQSAIGLILRR